MISIEDLAIATSGPVGVGGDRIGFSQMMRNQGQEMDATCNSGSAVLHRLDHGFGASIQATILE